MPMSHRHNRYARKNSPDSGTFSIDYLAFRELAQSIHGEQCVCVFLCRSEGYYWPQINCDLYVFDFWQYIRTQRTNFGWFLWHLWNGSSSLVCQKFIFIEILLQFFCVPFLFLSFSCPFDGCDRLKNRYRNHGFGSKMYLSLNLVILSQFSTELRTWMAAIHTRNACSIWL